MIYSFKYSNCQILFQIFRHRSCHFTSGSPFLLLELKMSAGHDIRSSVVDLTLTRFENEEWRLPWPECNFILIFKNIVSPDLRMGTSLTGHELDLGAVTISRPPSVNRQITWENVVKIARPRKIWNSDEDATHLFSGGWRREIETLIKAKAFHSPTLLKGKSAWRHEFLFKLQVYLEIYN